MADHKPSEPTPNDFKDIADKSQQAGIADEGAAYTKAIEKDEAEEASEAHPS
ncbi:hypothetical protein [Sphingomonas endolithica]|uniref:hypothetical protein n=1 Tax=Sphingomonas endolithica TaxID=2972485 RepID=UPI0021AF6D06|nr:hypothetical protein [Sphingomonas sp. ZFBP2030]